MINEIKEYIKKCAICLKSGDELINTKNRVVEVNYPNELWEIDLVRRLVNSEKQNKYIFVAIDHYTKWIETEFVERKNAQTISDLIVSLIIKKHGIPKRILTDNGLEFVNKEVQEMAKKYNIAWDFSSPGHHKTIGAVERVNQTLINKLKKLTNFGRAPWEELLEKATLATNISYNRSILTSPYIYLKTKNYPFPGR